ncbi:NfeD family protein [Yoonia sp.]|uniref:NfeD family protein n=1 Tax=Yoonia sp. TaxID=2212373 RepID=UPI002FDA82EB
MILWMQWWAWMTLALLLATLEVIIPGYLFLGFAVGAGVMGLLMLFGLSASGLALTLVVFAVISLAAVLVMRRVFALPKGQVKTWDTDINDN